MPDERTPLLASFSAESDDDPPSNATGKQPKVPRRSLYGRATHQFNSARATHAFMASLSTTALLVQVIIGAAVTALGASESSHVLITLFGATNTVIAGIVAYLKSRGQPMRTRMFRDDLERVVDEIENSETMWLGITQGIHGYDEIDIDDKVTVRSEVARLMRLYERAMRNNVLNNPDNYMLGGTDMAGTALRARGTGAAASAPVTLPVIAPVPATTAAPAPSAPAPVAAAPAEDPDESPATAPPKAPTPPVEAAKEKDEGAAKEESEHRPEASKNAGAEDSSNKDAAKSEPSQVATPAQTDPDESPASAPKPPSTSKPDAEPSDKNKAPES